MTYGNRRIEVMLWGALFLLHLAPVWGLDYFPTQDGPSHVENANILLLLGRPDLPVFRDYFARNPKLAPNWLGHFALAGLILITSPRVAEKILLTGYIFALPLAVRYAFRSARPESAPLAVLSFPFLFNCLLHYGFYNFNLSIALFFAAIGYWQGRSARAGWRESAVLAMILLAIYACHGVSWGLALVALAILSPRSTGWLALATAPSIAAGLWFFTGRAGGGGPGPQVSFALRWNGLWHFSTAVSSYAGLHQQAGAALALFLGCAAGACLLRRPPKWPIAFSAAVLVMYFALPWQAFGGMFLIERLNLYFFLSLLLWIAAVKWSSAWRNSLMAGAAVFSVALLALNLPWYREANQLIAEYLSGAEQIRANTAFVSLVYSPRGEGPMRDLYGEPLRHTAGYAAVMRSAVNLDNYEAETDLFPVMFRPERSPAVFIGAIENNPPQVRLDSPHIDYVLLWDPKRVAPLPPRSFVPVFSSREGAMRLFRNDVRKSE
jgi:hypothetical protein